MFSFFLVKVTDWPSIGKIAAHSAYEMFSWYKYLIVSLHFFSPRVYGEGIFFLIVPFPDLCLLVHFYIKQKRQCSRNTIASGWPSSTILMTKDRSYHAQLRPCR